jgi:hypothetical protein
MSAGPSWRSVIFVEDYEESPVMQDPAKFRNMLLLRWGTRYGLVMADCQTTGGGRFSEDLTQSYRERRLLAERVRAFVRFLAGFFGSHFTNVADALTVELEWRTSPKFQNYSAAYCEFEILEAVTQWSVHVTSSPRSNAFLQSAGIDITKHVGVSMCLQLLLSDVKTCPVREKRFLTERRSAPQAVFGSNARRGSSPEPSIAKAVRFAASGGSVSSSVASSASSTSSPAPVVAFTRVAGAGPSGRGGGQFQRAPPSTQGQSSRGGKEKVCWAFLAHALGAKNAVGEARSPCTNGQSCRFNHPSNIRSMDQRSLLRLIDSANMRGPIAAECRRAAGLSN